MDSIKRSYRRGGDSFRELKGCEPCKHTQLHSPFTVERDRSGKCGNQILVIMQEYCALAELQSHIGPRHSRLRDEGRCRSASYSGNESPYETMTFNSRYLRCSRWV
jgi:hypothetical protein